jgi:hypothetical protein
MSKFIHALLVERTEYDDTDRDDAGQPTPQTPTTTAVRGLVQPKTASEAEDYRSAGSEIADHTIFLPIGTDIRHADAIIQGARRYNVTGVRRFEFGGLAHLEVDAQLVTVTEPLAVGS